MSSSLAPRPALGVTLRRELDATAATSRATLRARAPIALVGSVMLASVLGPIWAGVWLAGLAGLEAALHALAGRWPREGRHAGWAGGLFVLLLAAIAGAWSVSPIVFWRTGRAPLQFAGMAILMAQLIDVQCYTFRLRLTPLVLGGVPAALFLILPVQDALRHGVRPGDDATLIFCLSCTAIYSVMAIRQNRAAAETLEASRLEAQAASQAKSAFVAMISHELRTPMNGVIGLAHALKASRSRAERDSQTDSIIRSGESLMVLLNDVLDLSKVEAGKMMIEARPFEIRALVEEIRSLWTPLAVAKGLDFACALEPDRAAWLYGDAARLRQILSNLVSNAVKFTEAGVIRVDVALRRQADGRVGVTAGVTDTGEGLTVAEQATLFRPFSQARDSVSREFGGTGLGLSISRSLVESMGGTLCARSRPSHGSTFELQLSLPPAPAAHAPSAPKPPSGAAVLAGRRVLAVDDNPINLQVVSALLRALGATAVTAGGGAEAIAALGEGTFDLVLMDIHMPRMGGLEALRRIRAGEGGARDVPVVACTADAMTDEVARLLAQGFDGVLPKPLVPLQMAAALGDVLASRAPTPDARGGHSRPGVAVAS